jgi:hypothetical protein
MIWKVFARILTGKLRLATEQMFLSPFCFCIYLQRRINILRFGRFFQQQLFDY